MGWQLRLSDCLLRTQSDSSDAAMLGIGPSGRGNGRKGGCDHSERGDRGADQPERRRGRGGQQADPVRHHQHRRTRDHQGRGRVRPMGRRAARRGRLRPAVCRIGRPRPRQRLRPPARRRPLARWPAHPRAPRRGAGRAHGVERAPVLRRGQRRLCLGPRGDRHEGHGRDDDRGGPAVEAGRHRPPRATWSSRSSPTKSTAAPSGRSGWSTTGRICSTGSPRRSARWAGSR